MIVTSIGMYSVTVGSLQTAKMSTECGGQASQSMFYLQKYLVNFYEIL